MDQKERSKLGGAARKKLALLRADEVEKQAQVINPALRLDKTTYQGTRFPCRWTDEGFGDFFRTPFSVLQQKAAFHPDHTQLRKKQAGVYDRLAIVSRQAFLDKYGVENPSQIPGVQAKVQATKVKNGSYRTSKEEQEFGSWLRSLVPDVCRLQVPASAQSHYLIDFYCPTHRLAIEYNGDFWHSSGNKKMTTSYHKKRQKACEAKDIQLIQVFASEWKLRGPQIRSFLTSKLLPPTTRLLARKLMLRPVDRAMAAAFFRDNHIQGHATGHCLGLFDGEQLVSACIVGRHHRTGQEWVLRRFATRAGTQVVGGLSRLSMAAVRLVQGPLITWVDLRWSTPAGYVAAGWKIETELQPDYWYWDDRRKVRIEKQARKKAYVNTPASMTEGEHAIAQRLWRVYDCGKARLRLDIPDRWR